MHQHTQPKSILTPSLYVGNLSRQVTQPLLVCSQCGEVLIHSSMRYLVHWAKLRQLRLLRTNLYAMCNACGNISRQGRAKAMVLSITDTSIQPKLQ